MKSKALVLAAICLSIFTIFSGCLEECTTDDDCEGALVCTDGTCVSSDEWSGKGLKGSFMLPVEVWEDEDFNVDVQIENVGEEPLTVAMLNTYLGGISLKTYGVEGEQWTGGDKLNYFPNSDLIQAKNNNELYAIREEGNTVIPGGLEDLNFGTLHTPAGHKDVDITLEATMCYPYKTMGVAQICIGNIKPGEEYVCKSNEDKVVDSTRAPVKITKVYQAGAGKSQTFTIYFENQGEGVTYVDNFDEVDTDPTNPADPTKKNCITSLEKSRKNRLYVTSVKVGDQALDCGSADKDVSLAAGRVVCYCSTGLCAKEAVSEAPLSIELNYNYRDKVSKTFTVKGI